MPAKPIELLLEVAKAFVRDMRAFHAERSPIKRNEIASRQIPCASPMPRQGRAADQVASGEGNVRGDEGSGLSNPPIASTQAPSLR